MQVETLPMTPDHVVRILDSRKTTTLQTTKISGYRELCIDGRRVVIVKVTPVGEVSWPVDAKERRKLVASEGYAGDENGFKDALCNVLDRRGHTTGTDFLKRHRSLILHEIEVMKP
jgi:hypothetical protein